MKTDGRKLARRRRICNAMRERQDGYRINWKRASIAYVIEIGIIASSLFAGWQLANRYAADEKAPTTEVAALGSWFLPAIQNNDAWQMAIIATIAIAVAEMARLPLVQGFRTQRSWFMRFFLLLGVLMMCVVTTKSMSQVMEQMFHPLLRFVPAANAELKVEQANFAKIETQKVGAEATAEPLTESVERLDAQIADLNKSLQGLGPQPLPRKVVIRVKRGKGKKVWYDNVTTYKEIP